MRFIFTILVSIPPPLSIFWCAVAYKVPQHMTYFVKTLFLSLSILSSTAMTQTRWYLRKTDTGTYVVKDQIQKYRNGANLFDTTAVNRAMPVLIACNPAF